MANSRPVDGISGCQTSGTDAGLMDEAYCLDGDLLRSAMLLTDEAGQATETLIYTAFGEPVTPDGAGGWRVGFPPASETRYQYAGGWGYESGLITLYGANPDLPPITLQHVGARWYDPGLGRFVQRDPIGIGGGLNLYTYVESDPLSQVDPTGEQVIHVGEPSPNNPTPYPCPPGSRTRIFYRLKTPVPPPWWRRPVSPITPGVLGYVCIAAVAGCAAGEALDRWHPGTPRPYSEHFGEWWYDNIGWFGEEPSGIRRLPNGDMVAY